MGGSRVFALLAVALTVLACAAPGSPSSRSAGRAAPDRVAVVPLNLAMGHAAELADAEAIVQQALVDALQARGARVGLVHGPDAERTWRLASSAAESAPSGSSGRGEADAIDGTARVFARALLEESDFGFDHLVIASVVYREARVHGRIARWDGVRRRVTSRRASGASQSHYFEDWEGAITGLSLHVRIYEPDGRRVHEGWGGLDLTHDPVVVGSAMTARLMPQARLLDDLEHVRQGVELALGPYAGSVRR